MVRGRLTTFRLGLKDLRKSDERVPQSIFKSASFAFPIGVTLLRKHQRLTGRLHKLF